MSTSVFCTRYRLVFVVNATMYPAGVLYAVLEHVLWQGISGEKLCLLVLLVLMLFAACFCDPSDSVAVVISEIFGVEWHHFGEQHCLIMFSTCSRETSVSAAVCVALVVVKYATYTVFVVSVGDIGWTR